VSLRAKRSNPQPAIKLPPPLLKGKVSLEEALAKRRSVRRYRTEPLTLFQLSQILWSAQGITEARKFGAAPSAGAAYPLEIFAVVGKQTIGDLEAGIYHYEVDSHSLRLHLQGDLRRDLAGAAPDFLHFQGN
jgi:Nitroreductase family.